VAGDEDLVALGSGRATGHALPRIGVDVQIRGCETTMYRIGTVRGDRYAG
jgi:hypothetical protein